MFIDINDKNYIIWQLNFIILEAEEGKVITNYKESDPIEEYSASTIMYCPKDLDISAYYEIDLSKHQQYVDLQTQKIEEKLKLNE